jgi:hypothetical protein
MQEGMIFHSLACPGTGVEVEQILCTSSEPLDLGALNEAWRRVRERYPVLRTGFRWEDVPAPCQEVLPEAPLEIDVVNVPQSDDDWLAADRLRDFNLAEPPLRLQVAKSMFAWRMLWSFHHAILDGRSFPVVLREVFDRYSALRDGRDWRPEGAVHPFESFVHHVTSRDHERSRGFWERAFADFSAPDHPLVPRARRGNSGDFGAVERWLDAETAGALQRWLTATGLSLNLALQAAWTVTVANRTRSADVVFGATRACRHTPVAGADRMVGLLINTVPVRSTADPGDLARLLEGLRSGWTALRDHELTPLTAIRRWAKSAGPLFDSLVVFDSADLASSLHALGDEWTGREFVYRGRTGYPLTMIGYGGVSPVFRLEYDRQVVGDVLASDLVQETLHVLTGLAARPTRSETPPSSSRALAE